MEDIRPHHAEDDDRREEPQNEVELEFASDDEVPFDIPRD